MSRIKPGSRTVLTTTGSDGACCAAAVLLFDPTATVILTSLNTIHLTLQQLTFEEPRPGLVEVCGVGIGDNLAEVLERLTQLRTLGVTVRWYCGRGYLKQAQPALAAVCDTVFEKAESNTEVVARKLAIPPAGAPLKTMLELAREFANRTARTDKHSFWHDLIQAACEHYLSFGEDAPFRKVLRKLAGLAPCTPADEEEVKHFRSNGSQSRAVLGNSEAMKGLRKTLRKIAPMNESVLILGPSGSGKELVARALHEGSNRRDRVFVPINCAVLTEPSLANDRLFGHVKGAFTSADNAYKGAFLEANGGTLFLDEVAEIPLVVQTQLLRVLEDRVVIPLGTQQPRSVDVRIIAATHQNLTRLVQQGRFRHDLYYRLNVLSVLLPSLKDRIEDARSIANAVLTNLRNAGHPFELTRADWKLIESYDWPGNVRQLVNLLKRAALMGFPFADVLARERLESTESLSPDAPQGALSPSPSTPAQTSVFLPATRAEVLPEDEIRKAYMLHVFKLFDRNWTQASRALEISENTLRKYIKAATEDQEPDPTPDPAPRSRSRSRK